MALKNSLTINLKSDEIKQISSYCKLNNIEDVDGFVLTCFRKGVDIEIYGLLGEDSGKTGGIQEKLVEIEVIREKRVEVPVEVEKIVEKIIEVPIEVEKVVEKIIEKPIEIVKEIEKIVYISDDKQITELAIEISRLEDELKKEKENVKTIEVTKEVIKEVKVEDNSKMDLIQKTLQELRKEIFDKNKRIKDLENIINEYNQNPQNKPALFHRGSNINEKLL